MKPTKIHIKIRKPFGNDWVRFHVVEKIILDDYGVIKTEGQLAKYIFDKYGEGRYQLLAWQKGHEGFWLYWLGDIMTSGWIRDRDENKELKKLRAELDKADSFEEKQDIEEEMEFEKEIHKEEKSYKWRGPRGIKTRRPGNFYDFEKY